MDLLWHEPVWEATGLSLDMEHVEEPARLEDIDSSAWAGWWHEGCCRV